MRAYSNIRFQISRVNSDKMLCIKGSLGSAEIRVFRKASDRIQSLKRVFVFLFRIHILSQLECWLLRFVRFTSERNVISCQSKRATELNERTNFVFTGDVRRGKFFILLI